MPAAQQRRELRSAEDRRRREIKAMVDALPARRPGLEHPGQRQLHRPDWLGAALRGVHTPEDAKAALAALRDAEGAS